MAPRKVLYVNITTFCVRFASAKLTDKRVRVMNEIISGIRVIKMYGWEYAFKKVIAGIRKSVCVCMRTCVCMHICVCMRTCVCMCVYICPYIRS